MIKKATIFKLAEGQSVTLQILQACAERHPSREPKSSEVRTLGFEPLQRDVPLAFSAPGVAAVCVVITEKVIPAACVKHAVARKVAAIRDAEGRTVGRKERQSIKDEIVFTMLPHAPTQAHRVPVFFSNGRVLFATTTASHVEAVQDFYRSTLGLSMRCGPVSNGAALNDWAAEGAALIDPDDALGGLGLGDWVELERAGAKAVLSGFDPHDDTPRGLVAEGMSVKRIALEWTERAQVRIDNALTFQSFKLVGFESTGETSADVLAADIVAHVGTALELWELLGVHLGHAKD